jgi:hypothetical protein
MTPPTLLVASIIMTFKPLRPAATAAPKPAVPPPTTKTSTSSTRVSLGISKKLQHQKSVYSPPRFLGFAFFSSVWLSIIFKQFQRAKCRDQKWHLNNIATLPFVLFLWQTFNL